MQPKLPILKSSHPITHIYHLADIHIRRENTRHQEYQQVFNKFYKILDQDPNIKTSLIIIVGDILHQKDSLSPDCVKLTCNFFIDLIKRTDVIILPGNHDLVENNPQKTNSLAPLINLVNLTTQPNKIYFLEARGGYIYNNLLLGVTHVSDETILPASTFNSNLYQNYIKIALYHGLVNKSLTDTNQQLTSTHNIKASNFTNYKYALLGDIHKHQYLDKKKLICYPSSLIQQNIGEELNKHGYVLWNLLQDTSQFHNIPNDYGFITLTLNNNIITPTLTNLIMPLYPTIRLMLNNINKLNEVTHIEKLKQLYPNYQKIYSQQLNNLNNINKTLQVKSQLNITTTEQLNNKIKKYIILKYPQYNKYISKILLLNTEIHDKLPIQEKQINKWKIKTLTFSNMFCYGDSRINTIDFTKFDNNIIGLFADNATGKSSLLNIILYTIFGKCPTNLTGLLNKDQQEFKTKITLDVSNVEYIITRTGKRNQVNKVNKVNQVNIRNQVNNKLTYKVDFHKKLNNKLIIINGEQKKDTNQEIYYILGSYEDYLLTSFCLQKSQSFLDLSDNNRKETLMKILNLNKFDLMLDTSREQKRDLTCEIKNKQQYLDSIINKYIKNKVYPTIETLETLLETQNKLNILHLTNRKTLETTNIFLNKEIKQLQTLIIIKQPIKLNINQINIKNLKHQELHLKEQQDILNNLLKQDQNIQETNNKFIQDKHNKIKKLCEQKKQTKIYNKTLKENLEELENINNNINNISQPIISKPTTTYNLIIQNYNNYNKLNNLIKEINLKIASNNQELKRIKTTNQELNKYIFNETCTSCTANKQILTNIKLQTNITKLTEENTINTKLLETHQTNLNILNILNPITTYNDYVTYTQQQKDQTYLELLQQTKETLQETIQEQQLYRSTITFNNNLEKQIKLLETTNNSNYILYTETKELITTLTSQITEYKITTLENTLNNNIKTIKKLTEEIETLIPSITTLNLDITNYKSTELLLEPLLLKSTILDIYIKIINKKDGLPCELFNDIIPILEQQTNLILASLVDFKIIINTENNKVNIYKEIKDDQQEIILCSGMERFIIDISLRIALLNTNMTSSLNALFIDEGFSCLDQKNTNKLQSFFEELTKRFDYILIISHLTNIKDIATKYINISKNQDSSSFISN